jgi:hypothetical protein
VGKPRTTQKEVWLYLLEVWLQVGLGLLGEAPGLLQLPLPLLRHHPPFRPDQQTNVSPSLHFHANKEAAVFFLAKYRKTTRQLCFLATKYSKQRARYGKTKRQLCFFWQNTAQQRDSCVFWQQNAANKETAVIFAKIPQNKETAVFFAVLRIYDILVWIRIRISGFMPLTNESGFRILQVLSLTFKTPTKN